VRARLVVTGVVTIALSLVGVVHAQTAVGGAGRGGTLGPIDALGQEVRRAPASSAPSPRLPDGTVDLNGLWIGGGPVVSIAQGLKPGETLPLLPIAAQLKDLRGRPKNEVDDPHLWCMPMGVPRTTPYPFRFVQNYTHRAPPQPCTLKTMCTMRCTSPNRFASRS